MPWEIFVLPSAILFAIGFFKGLNYLKKEDDN